jgi:hypothetical protein
MPNLARRARAAAGYGPQKLATLAAYALRRNLLDWLETFKVEKLGAQRAAHARALRAAAAAVRAWQRHPDRA